LTKCHKGGIFFLWDYGLECYIFLFIHPTSKPEFLEVEEDPREGRSKTKKFMRSKI